MNNKTEMPNALEAAEELTAGRQCFSTLRAPNGTTFTPADMTAKKRQAEADVDHLNLINRAFSEGRAVSDVLAEDRLHKAVEAGDVPGSIIESRAEIERIESELAEAKLREQDNQALFDSYVSLRDAVTASRTKLDVARLQFQNAQQAIVDQVSLIDELVIGMPENSQAPRFGIAFTALAGYERAVTYFKAALKGLENDLTATEAELAAFKREHEIR